MAENLGNILIHYDDPQTCENLKYLLRTSGYMVASVRDRAGAIRQAQLTAVKLVLVGGSWNGSGGLALVSEFSQRLPSVPLIFLAGQDARLQYQQAIRQGAHDVLCAPFQSHEVLRSVKDVLNLAKRRGDALLLESRRFTSSLQRQMDEMETLTRLGRQITASLDLDQVLTMIVDAAVKLTGADEGSLLLIDDTSGDLYMRASRNFQEDFVRTFRLPIKDSIAGQVIRTGEAVLFDESSPQKIKTAYLVQSLLYVPLSLQGRVLGVLGVDNRSSRLPLTRYHVNLLNALSAYAVVALENARLYAETAAERNKLETILTSIRDGVIVVDHDQRLGLVNRAAREAFGIAPEEKLSGHPFQDAFPQEEMLQLANTPETTLSNRSEISTGDDQVFSVQMAPVAGVGRAFTLHDITDLKKLDRIKTDFVHTVSHDLRSPLTSILGYVELIERAGPVTSLQRDFIRRVQGSVQNINTLVDDLLNLGRIESGFDVRKELIRLGQVLQYSVNGLKQAAAEKELVIQVSIPEEFPLLHANPLQMRQMIDQLLDNAVKYSAPGTAIGVSACVEQSQVILQFTNEGIGIPSIDLPYIFDRFYRAANAAAEMPGTGLGLSIVKSIVENHGGRIWVESAVGKGVTFTIVLPLPWPAPAD